MDRPDWIEAALDRTRSGIAGVRALPGKLSGGGEAEEEPVSAKTAAEAEKEPAAKAVEKEATAEEPKDAEPGEKKATPAGETAGVPLGERAAGVWDRARQRPWVAIGAVCLLLLVIVWIAWAIHVGSTNGGSAAVGVLITWPLFCLVVANLVLIGFGLTMLFRYLQPSGAVAGGGDIGAATASPAKKGPDEKASKQDKPAKVEKKKEKAENDEGDDEGEDEEESGTKSDA